jgi:hypothetical protein
MMTCSCLFCFLDERDVTTLKEQPYRDEQACGQTHCFSPGRTNILDLLKGWPRLAMTYRTWEVNFQIYSVPE